MNHRVQGPNRQRQLRGTDHPAIRPTTRPAHTPTRPSVHASGSRPHIESGTMTATHIADNADDISNTAVGTVTNTKNTDHHRQQHRQQYQQRRHLRRQGRLARQRLGRHERRTATAAIIRTIARHPAFRRSRSCALYMARDGEPDLQPLAHLAQARRKHTCLPVLCPPFLGNRLWFFPDRPPYVLNRWQIPQPAFGPPQPVATIDLLLMPLVAFDAAGHRLGMGKGFYDRTLQPLVSANGTRLRWRKPLLLGVAFEAQRQDAIDPAPWDIPLDAIVTERGWLWPERTTPQTASI